MPPITPTLDPIPDHAEEYEYEGDLAAGTQSTTQLGKTFSALSLQHLDEDEDEDEDEDVSRQSQNRIQNQNQEPHSRPVSKPQNTLPYATTSFRLRPLSSHSSSSSASSNNHLSLPNNLYTSNPTSSHQLARANSSPMMYSPPAASIPSIGRSGSPLRSPNRVRSPFIHVLPADDMYLATSVIQEDAELEIPPQPRSRSFSSSSSSLSFPRTIRRRPHSPTSLRLANRASSVPAPTKLLSGGYNEAFPTDTPYFRSFSLPSTSIPSTPTSARSRSPSISSLETIPDTPDEELEAIEQDQRDRQSRQMFWELYGTNGNGPRLGSGLLLSGAKDKRKRWSVCGAEKRGDFNLETILED